MAEDIPVPSPDLVDGGITLFGVFLYGGIILACIIIAIVYKVREKKKWQERGDRR